MLRTVTINYGNGLIPEHTLGMASAQVVALAEYQTAMSILPYNTSRKAFEQ